MKEKIVLELGRACPRGKIRRKAYRTKRGVRVPATCVTDVGAPGKTPAAKRFFPELGPQPLRGWKKTQPEKTRRTKLKSLAEKEGCRVALRRVNVIANVTADKPTEKKLRADYKWMRQQDWCALKTKRS